MRVHHNVQEYVALGSDNVMQSLTNDDSKDIVQRRLPQFTSFTRYHHPYLNPDFAEEDIDLVPEDLCPRG